MLFLKFEEDSKEKNNVLSHFNLGSVDDFSTEQIQTIYKQFKSKKLI